MDKTAILPENYQQYVNYAGYGNQGYDVSLDDPSTLPMAYYGDTQRTDTPPKWVGKTTAGLIGGALLLGLLGKGLRVNAAKRIAKRSKELASLEQRAQQAQKIIDQAQNLR